VKWQLQPFSVHKDTTVQSNSLAYTSPCYSKYKHGHEYLVRCF